MKPTGNLVLVITFAPDLTTVADLCKLVSANIGYYENDKFIVKESIKLHRAWMMEEFEKNQVKEFEAYLNSRWYNKGLLLLDYRDDDKFKKGFCKILKNLHETYGNDVKKIICGLVSKHEWKTWLEHFKGKSAVVPSEREQQESFEEEMKDYYDKKNNSW